MLRSYGLIFLLIVLGFPMLEIYMLFQVATFIGWWLLLWLILSVLIGWMLIKEESLAVFGRLAVAMQTGGSPFAALWASGRTILAGILLIAPGVISDAIAVILLLWPQARVRSHNQDRPDDGVIEGEVRVVEAEQIESRPPLK